MYDETISAVASCWDLLQSVARMSKKGIAGAPADIGAGVWIHKKKGEMVKKGEPLITIFADKSWKLTNALKIAQKDYPIIVEGMLLERVQTYKVL